MKPENLPAHTLKPFKYPRSAFALFILVQLLDGVFTLWGIHHFGNWIEANPIIAWGIRIAGMWIALPLFKCSAMGIGYEVFRNGYHRTLALSTLTYILFAIIPWTIIWLNA